MNRREVMKTAAVAAAATTLSAAPAAAPVRLPQEKIDAHDKIVDSYLAQQILDKSHRFRGSFPTKEGLFYGGIPSGILNACVSAYIHPQSKHHKSAFVVDRMKLAAEAFGRIQTPDGNWDLPITNFNSPPDAAFIMQATGQTIGIARKYGFPELEQWILPAVRRAGDALVRGGVHTPNHRWVICSALALLHKLYGDPKYKNRMEQWLAEGIDIDADGQYTERSSIGYNGICNRAFTILADQTGRMELLDPVRKNLDAMLYLIHADGEVVTEISRRQDLNQRGTMFNSWLGIAYVAWKDRNGVMANMARSVEKQGASLSMYLSFPQLVDSSLPPSKPMPDNYEKVFPLTGVARVRRGPLSVSILRNADRFFTLRHGDAVVNAVRFSSAFFGRGQFRAATLEKVGKNYVLKQHLDAGYYQPFEPARKITTETYDDTRHERRRTEISNMDYSAELSETPKGFRLHLKATGVPEVPLTVEISLREGGTFTGVEKHHTVKDAWMLNSGYATYTLGKDTLKIGPGQSPHTYIEVRGALPKLEGPCLYITAFTPVDQVIEFEHV